MFHLPPVMDIQLRDLYKNVSQRLSECISESRMQGVTASPDRTFSKSQMINQKSTVSTIRIFNMSSIGWCHYVYDQTYMDVRYVEVVHVAASDVQQTTQPVEKCAELQNSPLNDF